MTISIRGEYSRLWAFLIWLTAAIIFLTSIINGGLKEGAFVIPLILFLAVLGWSVWYQPHIEVSAAGIRVVNIVREHMIPWADFKEAINHWGLVLYTHSGKKISVWSMPSRTGLFSNSWRDRGKQADLGFRWDDKDSYARTAPLDLTVAELNMRLNNIRRNDDLRRRLTQVAGNVAHTSTTQLLPISAFALPALLAAILVFYFIIF